MVLASFVGVDAVSLFVRGDWVDELVAELHPYDAGTDSGVTYGSGNLVTNPPEPISRITGFPLLLNDTVLPFGTFTFRRID